MELLQSDSHEQSGREWGMGLPGGGDTKVHKPRRNERWEGKDKFGTLGAYLVTGGK